MPWGPAPLPVGLSESGQRIAAKGLGEPPSRAQPPPGSAEDSVWCGRGPSLPASLPQARDLRGLQAPQVSPQRVSRQRLRKHPPPTFGRALRPSPALSAEGLTLSSATPPPGTRGWQGEDGERETPDGTTGPLQQVGGTLLIDQTPIEPPPPLLGQALLPARGLFAAFIP